MGEKDLLLFVWCCVMAEQTQKNARFFCDTLTGLSVLHLFLWNMYNFDRRNLCDVADLQIIMQ